jgi:putative transposase
MHSFASFSGEKSTPAEEEPLEDREPYPTDLTDAQWRCLREYLPEPSDVGRPQEYEQREIINTILYVLHTGCQWEMVPHDLVPG